MSDTESIYEDVDLDGAPESPDDDNLKKELPYEDLIVNDRKLPHPPSKPTLRHQLLLDETAVNDSSSDDDYETPLLPEVSPEQKRPLPVVSVVVNRSTSYDSSSDDDYEIPTMPIPQKRLHIQKSPDNIDNSKHNSIFNSLYEIYATSSNIPEPEYETKHAPEVTSDKSFLEDIYETASSPTVIPEQKPQCQVVGDSISSLNDVYEILTTPEHTLEQDPQNESSQDEVEGAADSELSSDNIYDIPIPPKHFFEPKTLRRLSQESIAKAVGDFCDVVYENCLLPEHNSDTSPQTEFTIDHMAQIRINVDVCDMAIGPETTIAHQPLSDHHITDSTNETADECDYVETMPSGIAPQVSPRTIFYHGELNSSLSPHSSSSCSSTAGEKSSCDEEHYMPMTMNRKTRQLEAVRPNSTNDFGTLGRSAKDPLPAIPNNGTSTLCDPVDNQSTEYEHSPNNQRRKLGKEAKPVVKPRNEAMRKLGKRCFCFCLTIMQNKCDTAIPIAPFY